MALLSLARKLLNGGMAPRIESHCVLCRPLTSPSNNDPPLPEGMRLELVEGEHSNALPDLLGFFVPLGFGAEFCRSELRAGDTVALAVADATTTSARTVVAAASTTYRRHRVDAILLDFDPGADGCQFLNAYVAPAFRGRKLQRLLQRPRFRKAYADGKRLVYTIILTSNGPSLHNSMQEGFVPVLRVDLIRLPGLLMCNLRRLTHRLPAGRLSGKGWYGKGALRIARPAAMVGP